MSLLNDSVSSPDGGQTFTFSCPGVEGDPCHTIDGTPFQSVGWPDQKTAAARGQEHFDSHKHGALMTDLDTFREAHGLVAHADGIRAVYGVKKEDLP